MSDSRKDKKQQFSVEKKSNSGKKLGILAVLVILAAGAFFVLKGQGGSDGYTRIESSDGSVRVDLSTVDDGEAHFFRYASQHGDINFFVVKSVDGIIRAAFDACDVCYRSKKGYHQEGDFMVCNNCGQQFRTDLVNEVKGGCNPAPLARQIDGAQLVISEQDIVQGASYFGG